MWDPSIAQELAHEGSFRSTGRFRHLRAATSFDAYRRRTVVNLCSERFRRQRLEDQTVLRERPRNRSNDPAYSPEDREVVWSAILRLPFRQPAVIVVRGIGLLSTFSPVVSGP